MKVQTFLKNKYVLYVLSFFAVFVLHRYVSLEDYDSAMLCIILFFLSRYFSKNLSLNIILAISITYILSLNNNISEGFEVEKKIKKKEKKVKKKCDNCPEDKCVDGKCISSFKNNIPSSTPNSVDGHIDKDSTAVKMEEAFNDLNNLLGDNGIKDVTTSTKNLINQQKELMKTLNEMGPSLKEAKETLSGMNLPSIGDMNQIFKKLNQ